ncbi:MAG: 30S ribosomal protein S17 [Candidatus Omnitrophica bacterium]|nr:30S ribosomal protein S17 [Candidatus Omnitrophota bacterium]
MVTAGSAGEPAPPASASRSVRKTRLGVVISDRMKKTIVVRVDRLARHAVFSKVVKRSVRFKAHDETNQARIGDVVKIMETRPLSKDKRWRLVEIVRRGGTAPAVPGSEPETTQAGTV